jgi:hypothetical protein
MLDTLRKVLTNLFTGKDNKTYTPDRVFGALGFVSILLIIFLKNPPFMEICTGLALYLTSWCTGVIIKNTAEPAPEDKKDV